MAAKWGANDAEGRYYLQYRTAGDSRVRDTHTKLRNITLPANDAFWDSYYPPNGWRCRCTVVEVNKERYEASNSDEAIQAGNAATTAVGKDGNNTLAIFRFNPGKQQVIFPPKHPYKGDLSKCNTQLAAGSNQSEKCKVAAELEKQLKENINLDRKKADAEIKEWANNKIKKGLFWSIKNKEFTTGEVRITRSNIDNLLAHIGKTNNKFIVKDIENVLAKAKYKSSAEIDKNKSSKNYGKKIARGVERYNYYTSKWNERKVIINMEVIKLGYEQPYSITFDK